MSGRRTEFTADLAENAARIRETMQHTEDLTFIDRELPSGCPVKIAYLTGMIDIRSLEALLAHLEEFVDKGFAFGRGARLSSFRQAAESLAAGHAVLLFSDPPGAEAVKLLGVQLRSVEEPSSESTVKGPRSGFTESLSNNVALVRYYCPSPRLKVEHRKIGSQSPIGLAVLSVGGITNPQILKELHRRIDEIAADYVVGSNYIEEWIADHRGTMFPMVESTERPDRVVGALMDGRIAVLVQGTPFVILLPFVFLQAFQVGEDYFWNFYIGSLLRMLRIFCGLLGMLLPAFYVATVTFHHELVPTALLQSIAAAKEPVPFPAVVESYVMMFAFEIMREAGIRMPKQIGQAVSIVGALILGQAAVEAGIVSPIMVIVAALTGICTFTLPPNAMNYAIRLLQFGMTFLASLLGYVGIVAGVIVMLTYLASLRSFGVPYLGPAAPLNARELTDVVVRRPIPWNAKRPTLFRAINPYRFRGGDK
ncbi:spore germination protein [Cohnella hongkongensis]|uniref:Spore germination protein n=1 Tax=Cohnella hongkongensis TaxID=178337 RepID=A0ABV9F4Y2_9BACL